MILDNPSYDKIKLIHELSKINWFLEKHALEDAKLSGDNDCHQAMIELHKDIQRHIERLHKQVCLITQ